MGRIRVLIVNGTLYGGGAEHVIATIARNLDQSRFDATVCCLKDGGVIKDQLYLEGYSVVDLSDPQRQGTDYRSALRLRKFVKASNFDIIHSHNLHSMIDSSLVSAVTPKLRHIHTFHFGNYPHLPRKHLFLERVFSRLPDRLVAVGHSQSQAITSTFGHTRDSLDVIWNGVDSCQSAPKRRRPSWKVDKAKVVIGALGTLIPQKNFSMLLEVASILRTQSEDFQLVIAGDGVLRPQLERQIRDLNLEDHVQMLGWIGDASQSVLPHLDIFVQTSNWEAMTVVVLEAMAAGKPIVATNVGDNSRVLLDGESGVVLEKEDVTGFAKALSHLIRDPAERQRIGSAAQRRFEECFTAKEMARRHEHLYLDVASTK